MEDFSKRTLRELIGLARERLGSSASALKTREELLSALAPPGEHPAVAGAVAEPPQIVTRHFFVRRP